LCKKKKRKEKRVFSFFFFVVWIDREVSNYNSMFPYFHPLPCNQTWMELGREGWGLYLLSP